MATITLDTQISPTRFKKMCLTSESQLSLQKQWFLYSEQLDCQSPNLKQMEGFLLSHPNLQDYNMTEGSQLDFICQDQEKKRIKKMIGTISIEGESIENQVESFIIDANEDQKYSQISEEISQKKNTEISFSSLTSYEQRSLKKSTISRKGKEQKLKQEKKLCGGCSLM